MLRVTCDSCGKEIDKGVDHHVLKLEVYIANEPSDLTEDDLDEDHLEAVSELLQQQPGGEESLCDSSYTRKRYDLCPACRRRFLRDPLGLAASTKLHFSKN
ncbi:MAG: hypothetical protein EBV06_04075 [Planctomycetia bacterium]|nr:hypothetical protein [Planctomycetia bacterium]